MIERLIIVTPLTRVLSGKRLRSGNAETTEADPIAKEKEQIQKEDRWRRRDPLYWARGRLVAIRPDGASKGFDPDKARLYRTQQDHERHVMLFRRFWEQMQKSLGRAGDIRPEWLRAGIERDRARSSGETPNTRSP
jgi:hypothetical protein